MIIEDLLGKEILDHLRIKKNEIPNLKLFASKELHYPAYIGKGASGYKRCQVCKSENKKSRSAYKCEQCTKISGEDVALCILPCFKIFHENPSKYFEKKKRAPLKKIKIV